MSRSGAILALLFAMAMIAACRGASTLSCSTVYSSLYPCLGYLQGGGRTAPPSECCGGIKSLMSKAKTGSDRRVTCNCLKTAAAGVSGQNIQLAGALPSKCHVNVPYSISPSTDCNKVN